MSEGEARGEARPGQVGALDRLLARFGTALDDGTLVKLTLGAPRSGTGPERLLQRLLLRPVLVRGRVLVSCVERYARRDVTTNLAPDDARRRVAAALASEFRTAHLFTTTGSAQLDVDAGGRARLHEGPPRHAALPSLAHDRSKRRAFDPAAPWLAALGVTAGGRVRRGMEGKLRQMERFVELLHPRIARLARRCAGRPLQVVDMASGKGYLTFAMAAALRAAGIPAEVLGVEQRAELVEAAQQAARAHGFTTLHFTAGEIANAPLAAADVVLALHACDTATDDALARGVAAGAAMLVASPCCHRELHAKLAPPAALAPLHRHGILRGRQAELVTDALRAALLEAAGYAAEVFEFVGDEHTAKNLMLVAIRRARFAEPARAAALHEARALAAAFGLRRQRLADALGIELTSS